jgi:dTDP-4-amino-4,6-dideoxygalactose transaminase
MAQYAPRVELPATTEVARTHLAVPMSAVLTAAQAAEVTQAVRTFAGAAV